MILERVNSTPARWWSLVGLVLVPLLIAGGFLIAGLNSDTRLHTVKAAVVNLDDPVTIDGTYIPLGRQLTANLVDSERSQNLTWTLDSEANARAGLATGAYAAMVIIPKNFSAAATSYAKDAADAERATIELSTSPVAGVADATLGKAVAMAAATSLNETLTSGYLDKIYVGFNDLGENFTTMADGADQLASGLEVMHTKIATMPASTDKLASGTAQYVAGVNQLVDQTITSLPQQAQLADGVHQLSQGAAGVSSGLSTYQSSLKANATAAAGGATMVTNTLQAFLGGSPSVPEAALKATVNGACPSVSTGSTTSELVTAAQVCIGSLTATAQALDGAAAGLDTTDPSTGQSLKSGASALAGGMSQLDSQLSSSMPDVAATTKNLKKLKSGGTALADGTRQLADGIPALVDGVGQLADGSRQMADGIAQGKDKLPSYTTSERENLSEVVAAPVSTDGLSGLADPDVGWVSLLLILALWVGAMATYVVLQPAGRALLGSAEPTAKLIAEALVPGLAILAVQAILMGALAHFGLALSWPKTASVTGVLLLVALAFALINHALVSWLGGAGRLLAVGLAVVTTAASLAPAAPGVLAALRPFSPLTTALDAVRAVITESSGAALATFSVVGWLVVAAIASSVSIARHRTTTLTAVVTT
jgi:putative membrane protein